MCACNRACAHDLILYFPLSLCLSVSLCPILSSVSLSLCLSLTLSLSLSLSLPLSLESNAILSNTMYARAITHARIRLRLCAQTIVRVRERDAGRVEGGGLPADGGRVSIHACAHTWLYACTHATMRARITYACAHQIMHKRIYTIMHKRIHTRVYAAARRVPTCPTHLRRWQSGLVAPHGAAGRIKCIWFRPARRPSG
jgi:hypothetical protein